MGYDAAITKIVKGVVSRDECKEGTVGRVRELYRSELLEENGTFLGLWRFGLGEISKGIKSAPRSTYLYKKGGV